MHISQGNMTLAVVTLHVKKIRDVGKVEGNCRNDFAAY